MQEKIYDADIYLRLSKEDGDKEESDSIAHQEAMLREFVESMPNIRLHKVRKDDGYSGVDFNRPDFINMIDDIKAGKVNCVIVKDFSRFGRNYIEAGKYIQVLFPKAGIRFIAVNDSYDSEKEQGYTSNIIVPFKNMVNDAYSADLSVKVRSHLDIKRKKGDFVGAFAVYGYTKDPENNNRLIIDDFSADVVKDIYVMKLEGMSALGIAERLNERGILSPMEYKRYLGSRFSTSFKLNPSAKWQAVTVARILKNEVYTGVLEQGKRVSPNYKIRKRDNVPKEKWVRVENAHAVIIDRPMFETVQELLKQDTRASSKNEAVKPLSGVILCADCGAAMVHKTNTNNGKRYGYYVCSGHRANKESCSTHMISTAACETAVLVAVKTRTAAILDIEKIADSADAFVYSQGNVRRLTAQLEAKQEELRRNNDFRLSLYESYGEGVISREDFISFKANYDVKVAEAEAAISVIKEEIERAAASERQNHGWTSVFKNYMDSEILTRKMVVELLTRVAVHEKGRLTVDFRYSYEFELMKGAA
ncbi:MAG: recombinase family protein [Defluviitaleaceae bacterium]|nr:recombinase family protein [Defluviitaleaceae bacterium]MCL2275336.1 recombinase family protein [Defluviitaleaceae bacterium]